MKQKLLIIASSFILVAHASSILSVVFAQTAPPVRRDMEVTAFIPPKVSDFQFDLNSDSSFTVPQLHTVTYEINYGASTSAATNSTNTIVVDFSNDLAPDRTHVVDYVIGSASKGYYGAQPVIDLKQRTITWTLINLPPGVVDQTLTFKLTTNNNYTVQRGINFTVQARMNNEYITLPVLYSTHQYTYDPSLITPGPTAPEPTAQPTAPTPTPLPIPLRIIGISFNTISTTNAEISVRTNRPAKHIVMYGTSPTRLDQTIQTDNYSINSPLELQNLKADTSYFFKITAIDATGKRALSELFTFTTARSTVLPELMNNSVAVTSGETVILSEVLSGNKVPFGIITTMTDYILTYTFSRVSPLAFMELIIRDMSGNDQQTITMNGQTENSYTARLRSGSAGTYQLFVRITDTNGNVIEQEVATMKVIRRLQVVEKETSLPIGDARIVVKYFNPAIGEYELVLPERFGSKKNPAYTNTGGELDLLLPSGKYQAEVSAMGYDGQTLTFTLGSENGQELPTIFLTKNLTNFTALFQSMQDWFIDTYTSVQTSLLELYGSIRFFNSIAFTILLSFILTGFVMFGLRTDIEIRDLIPYFLFHLFVTAKRHRGSYIYGVITDMQKKPLSLAWIEVVDLKSNIVLAHAITNKAGRFVLRNTFKQHYVKLVIGKEGFQEYETTIPTDNGEVVQIQLDTTTQGHSAVKQSIFHVFGELFEFVLLLCLIAELFFIASFGIAKTMPFFLLSLFNLLLWLFFQREKKTH